MFLVPADNCLEAVGAAPDGLKLVRVATLDEALTALDQLKAKKNPRGC